MEPLLARCCGAGVLQFQPRGTVVSFLGVSPQSNGPCVRVIAPEKEVMIGGAGLEVSERGVECACFGTKGSSIRRGAHRGESKHAITCSSGKGGRPGSSQEAEDSSDSGASFREEARFFGGNRIPMLESHDAGRSLWGLIQDSHAGKAWHVPSSA